MPEHFSINQWRMTADELITIPALNHTVRPGESYYIRGNSNRALTFWVIATLAVDQGTYKRIENELYRVTETEIKTYLTNQGETLPGDAIAWVKPLSDGGRVLMVTSEDIKGRL